MFNGDILHNGYWDNSSCPPQRAGPTRVGGRVVHVIISTGVFGWAGGGTNGIAVIMLLYKIPLLCGSG